MTPEEHYKKIDYPTLDKFDKKAHKFDYYDLLDFAESYHQAKLKLLGIANVIISLPEHEKWIKISDAINKAKKKRQDQGFNLGVVKGGLYSMGFEDAIKWLLGNEL